MFKAVNINNDGIRNRTKNGKEYVIYGSESVEVVDIFMQGRGLASPVRGDYEFLQTNL